MDRGANQHALVSFWKRDNQELNSMDIDQLAERLDVLEKADKEKAEVIEKLEAQNAELDALSKMSDVEKGFMSNMSDEEKKKFMGMSADERKEKMKKAEDTEGATDTVAKADFEAIQKRADELAAKVEKMESDKKFEDFRKGAIAQVPSLAQDEKADFVKSLFEMPEDARGEVLKTLADAEKAKEKFMFEKGHGAHITSEPVQKLDTLVEKYAAENKVSKQAAYAEVLKTSEGAELYNETLKN